MEIDRLRVFVTILDAGSMTAAAARLRLTQPALSRALKALEEEVGTEIFERVGRGLVLSQAGRALERDARSLLDASDALQAKMRQVSERRYFDLRLGAVDSLLTHSFPRLVTKLRTRHPGLNLKVFADRSPKLLARIENEELDFAAVAHHGPPPSRVTAIKIAPYRMRFFGLRESFPELASVHSETEIGRFPVVALQAVEGVPECAPESASFAVTGSMASAKALIMAGFGVGALVEFMVSPHESKKLVASAYSNADEDCHVYVILARNPSDQWRQSVLDLMCDELKSSLAGSRPMGDG